MTFLEFIGHNYNYYGYSNARYRAYYPTIRISVTNDDTGRTAELDLPSKLEALNRNGEWVKHPVVFRHDSDYKGHNGYLIIFLMNGWQSHYLGHKWNPCLNKFYEEARDKGLTEGNENNIMTIVKGEE